MNDMLYYAVAMCDSPLGLIGFITLCFCMKDTLKLLLSVIQNVLVYIVFTIGKLGKTHIGFFVGGSVSFEIDTVKKPPREDD